MSPATLSLALLAALGAQAQPRLAPVRAPALAPTLSAPLMPALTPGGLAPSLSAPKLSLPTASAGLPAAVALAPVPTGASPVSAAKLAERSQTMERFGPAFAEEAALAADRLAGRNLTGAEREDAVARTKFVTAGLWKRLFNEFGVMFSYPDGVAREDLSIELTRTDPRRLPDEEAHYRALFAHEYTHRLQFEGDVSRRQGVEAAPVAVELLRGIELVGLEALKAGRIPFISQNVLDGFESGRQWARLAAEGRFGEAAFYFKGALAGAAWELAKRTLRAEDAWEFVRRVASQKRPEDPAKVYSDIAGR